MVVSCRQSVDADFSLKLEQYRRLENNTPGGSTRSLQRRRVEVGSSGRGFGERWRGISIQIVCQVEMVGSVVCGRFHEAQDPLEGHPGWKFEKWSFWILQIAICAVAQWCHNNATSGRAKSRHRTVQKNQD